MAPRVPDNLFTFSEEEVETAKRSLETFARPRVRVKKNTIGQSVWQKACANAIRFMAEGDWKEAWPRDFVAAYAVLHKDIYGIDPIELTPEIRMRAAAQAANLLTKEFHDDKNLFADFLRWTWTREEAREKWRRENGRPGGRIGWNTQFIAGGILSDWRLDHVRRRK